MLSVQLLPNCPQLDYNYFSFPKYLAGPFRGECFTGENYRIFESSFSKFKIIANLARIILCQRYIVYTLITTGMLPDDLECCITLQRVCQMLLVGVGDNDAQYLVMQRQQFLSQLMTAFHTH